LARNYFVKVLIQFSWVRFRIIGFGREISGKRRSVIDSFSYKNGKLFAEGVDVAAIANQVGTPVYIYSKATFLDHLKKIQTAYADIDTTICYSVKACGNINILKKLAAAGSGFDIVSGGELYRAQQAGADMSKIVFAGVGKTDAEIIEALDTGIGYFNIESEAELENLIMLCKVHGKITKSAPASTTTKVFSPLDFLTTVRVSRIAALAIILLPGSRISFKLAAFSSGTIFPA